MKRWLSHLTIVSYLSFLMAGIVCHTVSWGVGSHPVMYYIVWDMFCGWAAYEVRYHALAEGESGTYYELTPAPWGELAPYGSIGRRHYDPNAVFSGRLAQNVLKHTEHEPIVRIFVVEENWSKKYNLPDHLWQMRFEEPKEPYNYYHVRHVLTGDGMRLAGRDSWLTYQAGMALASNPRLRADAHKSQPFIAVNGLLSADEVLPVLADGERRVGSPQGN